MNESRSALLAPRETWHLPTAHIGRRVNVFEVLDSTNTTAAAFAANDPEANGLAIIADFQAAGRGQYGRVWQAPRGHSLLMSVVLRPPSELRRPVILTAMTAIAVAEAVYAITSTQARVKWPNDLLVRGKKVCGLLIEQDANGIVIGIGLNLTQNADDFVAAELPDAVSLRMISGREVTPRTAAEIVLERLDREYTRLLAGERIAVEADWKWRIGLLGREVSVTQTDGSKVIGRLHEMSFDGLELEVAAGIFRVMVPETVTQLQAI